MTMTTPRPVTPLGILARMLADISRRIDASDVDPLLKADLHAASDLAGGLDPYLAQCTTPESPALQVLARHTAAEDWSRLNPAGSSTPLEQEMLSGHVEGQVLKFLVRATRARRVLEIGMFSGYSALAMAEALPVEGIVIACELDPRVAEFAQRCFDESPDGTKIAVHVGPALDTLEQLTEPFDLIFIDADKPSYTAYVEAVLGRGLLAADGVICVDNTLMQGQPYLPGDPTANGRAIAEFNRVLAADDRVEQVLIPLRDGLTLIHRTGQA